MTLSVAIIGRPNVGKSTLFNRLVGKRLALVDDTPGVTRDRRQGEARLGDLTFDIVDTAGLEDADSASLAGRMRAQTEQAIAASDLVMFMIDARAGVTPVDEHFAKFLRKTDRPIVLLANKAEGRAGEPGVLEAYGLGLGEPIAISAEHGEGLADLYNVLRDHVDAADLDTARLEGETDGTDDESSPMRIAIIGRPNAGKSTLVNRLIGEERLLTGPEAGITRDAIAVDWRWRDRPIRLYDTAGLRRKSRVSEKLEKLSVADALRAIRFAEVVVVMIDATMPFEKQDLQIADLVVREGRALVIAVNKWDLIDDPAETRRALEAELERLLPQVRGVPLVTISGLTGSKLDRLMDAVLAAHAVWNQRISTAKLNRWLDWITASHPPPAPGGRRIRLRYMTQPKSRPPHFVVFCSRPEDLPESYRRYLLNSLRDTFDLPGIPLRLTYRKGDNPYAKSKR